jgi:MFS family permease
MSVTDLADSDVRSQPPLPGWAAFLCVSLMFFFLNLATFQTLGVVLFKMVAELSWSQTAAGSSFVFLGLACGLMSPLPALTIRKFGSRATLCIGSIVLAAGFWLCANGDTLVSFYIAMTMIGAGFSFSGTVPGVYLIAGWFEKYSSRAIGFYFMFGALGAAFGPPIVDWIVKELGWRGHWTAMAVVAGLLGVICLLLVRDRASDATAGSKQKAGAGTPDPQSWTPRQAMMTRQFILVAAAMTGTMACVLTLSSMVIRHLVDHGATPTSAAFIFGILGLVATFVKAAAGWACEKIRPETIAAVGLLLQMVGNILFAFAASPAVQLLAAIAFGAGWGFTYVAGPVLLIRYFGRTVGPRILSGVWLATTLSAAGPLVAGLVADRWGSFTPIFYGLGGVMLVLALPVWLMRMPVFAATGGDAAAPEAGNAGTVLRNPA